MPAREVPDRIAAMIVDPGSTTGLGWGVFNLRAASSFAAVREANMELHEVVYGTEEQFYENEGLIAEHCAQQWLELQVQWTLDYVPIPNQYLVIEDFILRLPAGSGKRSGISPARITGMIMGMLYQHTVTYRLQQPSEAKAIDNQKLRKEDLWVVGSEHKRDIVRHAVVLCRKLM